MSYIVEVSMPLDDVKCSKNISDFAVMKLQENI